MTTIREAFMRYKAGQIDADTFIAIVEQEMVKAEKKGYDGGYSDGYDVATQYRNIEIDTLKQQHALEIHKACVVTPEMYNNLATELNLEIMKGSVELIEHDSTIAKRITTALQKRARGEE